MMYRIRGGQPQVLLVHPGGPYWKNKDEGSWSIPKGEFGPGEDPLQSAIREFSEETGAHIEGAFLLLRPVKQKGGKIIHAWALEGDLDAEKIISNTFEMEWPPASGKKQSFPEADRAAWFDLETATKKIVKGQIDLVRQLEKFLQR